jgi:O-antigen ligase
MESGPFAALVAFLFLVFLMGGASRGDALSLVILRPAAVIVCCVALWTLTWEQVKANALAFGLAASAFLLVALHLVPLPAMIWGALPGREIISRIDAAAGLASVWRPLTMVPEGGWNAFYSMFVPLAVLLLGAQLSGEQRHRLLPWLIGLGLASGLVGLLQVIGDPQGPLYLYRVTNNGSAVGLFANRNHQATLLALLFPMLALFASHGIRTQEQAKLRGGLAIAAGIVIVPLLLVTGSRAGLAAGVIGLVAAAILYRKPMVAQPAKRKAKGFDMRYPAAALLVIILGALSVIMSRADAFLRLSAPDQTEDLRFRMWGPIADMAWKYFPFGSGAGSFVEVFQIDEPYALLKPTYVNHAHNDWLELYLTFGLPGILILAVFLFLFAQVSFRVIRYGNEKDARFPKLGVAILGILAAASIVDYPLRTPIMMCIFVVALIWTTGAAGQAVVKRTGS